MTYKYNYIRCKTCLCYFPIPKLSPDEKRCSSCRPQKSKSLTYKQIKQLPPDRIDPCSNPECPGPPKCKGYMNRWNNIHNSFRAKYGSIYCANTSRAHNAHQNRMPDQVDRGKGCHRKGLLKGCWVACGGYSDCLETVAKGGKWKCKGENWHEPNEIRPGTMGGSFAVAEARGGWIK